MRLTRWLAAECAANRAGFAMAVLFLITVIPLACVFAVLVPPGNIADEHAHAARAAAVAHGEIVGYRHTETGPDGNHVVSGVDTDTALPAIGFVFRQFSPTASAVVTPQRLSAAEAIPWGQTLQYREIGAIATYFPVFYLPAATALYIARHSQMNPLDGFLMARLFNVACLALIGAAALLVARRGHGLLFCVLASPMAVSLAASLNQDGLAIATAVLGAALLTRQGTSAVGEAGPSLPAAAFCILCVALAKPPFLPLAALLLVPLPPPRDWPRQRRMLAIRIGAMLLVALPVVLWSSYVASHVVGTSPRPVYDAGPLWPGPLPARFNGTDTAAQMTVFTAHPWRFVTLTWDAIVGQPILAYEMIGVLGWLDVMLPKFLYWLWPAALVAATLGEMAGPVRDAPRPRWPDMLLVPGVLLLTMVGLATSVYLTWIQVGAAHNDSMQGRYLLPLVPMLALMLPRWGIPGGRLLRLAGLALPALAALAGMIVIPNLIVSVYYLH
jgi:uncharacterized membrane protein